VDYVEDQEKLELGLIQSPAEHVAVLVSNHLLAVFATGQAMSAMYVEMINHAEIAMEQAS